MWANETAADAIKGHQSQISCKMARQAHALRGEGFTARSPALNGRAHWFEEAGIDPVPCVVVVNIETRLFVPDWADTIVDDVKAIRSPSVRRKVLMAMSELFHDPNREDEFRAAVVVLKTAGVGGLASHLLGYEMVGGRVKKRYKV